MSRPDSITTRTGDAGTTRLFSGEVVDKDHPRTEAYGDLDELVSLLGVARAAAAREETRREILTLQRELFTAGAELATTSECLDLLARRVDEAMVAGLDRRREDLERRIVMPAGFILPGGTLAGGHLDHARAVARRCERRVVGLIRRGDLAGGPLLVWFNRLSDHLWLLARFEEGGAVQPKDPPGGGAAP